VSKLDTKCCIGYDTDVLVVRGSSTWAGGRLYYGGGCVGNLSGSVFGQFIEQAGVQECILVTCEILYGLTPGCQISDECVPDDNWWNEANSILYQIQDDLYQFPVNGATFWEAQASASSL